MSEHMSEHLSDRQPKLQPKIQPKIQPKHQPKRQLNTTDTNEKDNSTNETIPNKKHITRAYKSKSINSSSIGIIIPDVPNIPNQQQITDKLDSQIVELTFLRKPNTPSVIPPAIPSVGSGGHEPKKPTHFNPSLFRPTLFQTKIPLPNIEQPVIQQPVVNQPNISQPVIQQPRVPVTYNTHQQYKGVRKTTKELDEINNARNAYTMFNFSQTYYTDMCPVYFVYTGDSDHKHNKYDKPKTLENISFEEYDQESYRGIYVNNCHDEPLYDANLASKIDRIKCTIFEYIIAKIKNTLLGSALFRYLFYDILNDTYDLNNIVYNLVKIATNIFNNYKKFNKLNDHPEIGIINHMINDIQSKLTSTNYWKKNKIVNIDKNDIKRECIKYMYDHIKLCWPNDDIKMYIVKIKCERCIDLPFGEKEWEYYMHKINEIIFFECNRIYDFYTETMTKIEKQVCLLVTTWQIIEKQISESNSQTDDKKIGDTHNKNNILILFESLIHTAKYITTIYGKDVLYSFNEYLIKNNVDINKIRSIPTSNDNDLSIFLVNNLLPKY